MGLFTYDDGSRRESLLDVLKDVSPNTDNYLTTNLGTSMATNTLHEWVTYNSARATSVTATAEGADFSDRVLTAPARSQNITEILTREVRVSGTQRAVTAALPGDPMDFQKGVALRELKQLMEFEILNGSGLTSGASGTARAMAGINNVISTNLTARASGTSMSTAELEDIMQNSWDAVGSEYVADIALTTMGIKRKIAGFTTRVTPFQESGTEIYNNVSVYHSSSGSVKIIPHKDVINATGSTHFYALREDTYFMAFLQGREPFYQEISKVGDADRGQYITELTLESRAERASVKRLGYALNG